MRRPVLRPFGTAKSFLVLAGLGIAAGFFVASATPAPQTKFYRASLTDPASANIPAGETTPVTIRLANCAGSLCVSGSTTYVSTQTVGSANITFPSPLSVASIVSVTPPSGKTWNATPVGNTVQLRTLTNADGLVPGQWVDVRVGVTVPPTAACTGSTPYLIGTAARQTNDFSGPPGNAFANAFPAQPTLGISPGALDHFDISTIASPGTAGTAITVQATARDACGAAKTNYAGGAVLSGNLTTSPGFPPSTPGTAPAYGSFGTWTAGVATTTVTPFAATTYNTASMTYNADFRVTVTDGSATGQSNFFAVVADDAAVMTFTQAPTRSYINSDINATLVPPGVKVKVQDAYGNLKPGAPVGIELGDNPPGTGVLTGTLTQTADSNGVATYLDLQIDQPGLGYTLIATSPPGATATASVESSPFLVLTTTANCPPCTGQVSIADKSTLHVSASGYQNGSTLGLALLGNYTIPPDVCDGFTSADGLPGAYADVTPGTSGTFAPSLTVTLTIDQMIVDARPNSGASQWDICLGSVNLLDPDGSSVTPWTEKDGTPSDGVFDPILDAMLFWGVLPDVTGGVGSCSEWATVPGAGPAVLSRNKVNGDVMVVFCVPYPWDPQGIAG